MARKKRINVILDTNWYISASINKKSRQILFKLLSHPQLNLLYSTELLSEYKEVISRPKFKKLIQPWQVNRFMNLVLPELSSVTIQTHVPFGRDQDDHYLLSLSVDGNASYLITGDDDLLSLENFGSTRILRMNEFMEILDRLW